MASVRQQVLAALLARLQAIQVQNGYQTDAGGTIALGELPQLGPDDPSEAIVLQVGEEEPAPEDLTGRTLGIRLPLLISAVAKAELGNNAWLAVEAILGDVKSAVELADVTLGGLLVKSGLERGSVRTTDREPGSTVVGMTITYIAPYREVWGTP